MNRKQLIIFLILFILPAKSYTGEKKKKTPPKAATNDLATTPDAKNTFENLAAFNTAPPTKMFKIYSTHSNLVLLAALSARMPHMPE